MGAEGNNKAMMGAISTSLLCGPPSKRVYCLNSPLARSTLFGGDLQIIADSILTHLNLHNLQILPNLLKQKEKNLFEMGMWTVKSEGVERREKVR